MEQKQQEQSSSPAFNTTLLQFGDTSPLPHLVLPANNPSSHPGPSAAHTEPGLQFGDTSPLVLSPGPPAPPKLPLVLPSSPVLSPTDDSPDPKSSSSDRPALLYPTLQKRTNALDRMIQDALARTDPNKTGKTPALTRKERRKLKQRANRAKGRREKAESQKEEKEKAEKEKEEKEEAEKEEAEKEEAEKEEAEKEEAEKEEAEKEEAEKEEAEKGEAGGEDRTRTPNEDPAPVAAPAQPEPSENSPPAAAPEQPEPSENSPPAAAPEQPQPSENSPNAAAPAPTRKQRRRQKQRANRALAARERAEREAGAHPSENPPPAQPAYTPPITTSWTARGADPAVGPYERAMVLFNETRGRGRVSRGPFPAVSQHPPPGVLFLPEVRPFHVDIFPPPGQGVGPYPMEYHVPRTRYVVIKYFRPPGAQYSVPAVFGPDPSGYTAWYDGASGGFVAAYPWISVGGGEAVNPGFGNPGHYWPDYYAWVQVYNEGLRRGEAALWPSQFANSDSSHGLGLVVEENDEASST